MSDYSKNLTNEQKFELGMLAFISDYFTGNKIAKRHNTKSQNINYWKKKVEKAVMEAQNE